MRLPVTTWWLPTVFIGTLVAESPRQRRIMLVYKQHASLEICGRWQEIFAPRLTVEVGHILNPEIEARWALLND
jgi:hypothetical protein